MFGKISINKSVKKKLFIFFLFLNILFSIGLNAQPYCQSNATSTADGDIINFSFGSFSNTSTCFTTGSGSSILNCYSDFTNLTPLMVNLGSTYSFSIQVGTCNGNYDNGCAIWIDYNIDGDFADAGEYVYFSPALTNGPHTENGNITIPASAVTGTTRLRVICTEFSIPSNPCSIYSWGETEDYPINIIANVPCSGTPVNSSTIATPSNFCSSLPVLLTLSSSYPYSGISYQWQSSPDNTVWSNISGATFANCNVTPSTSTYFRCYISCSTSGQSVYSTSTLVTSQMAANDLICDAIPLNVGALTPGDNTCSWNTGEPSPPACWTNGSINTVWFKFTAPASGTAKIKTQVGSLMNTQIAVYTAATCTTAMTYIGCNDNVNSCGWNAYYNSELFLSGLTAGSTYYIAVDGYASATGTFSIVWVEGSSNWTAVPGQDCGSLITMCSANFTIGNPGYQAVGNICDFPGGGGNCLMSGERGSAWYEIRILTDGSLMFTLEPNDAIANGSGLITSYGTDYDYAIWKKTGTGAVTCADIANGAIPIACNYSAIGITGLCTGGNNPSSNSYTGHAYSLGAYDAAFEPPIPVLAGESYYLVISNYSNSTSGFQIDFSNSGNIFNFNAVNPLIWTGGASTTNWFDPKNWGNCAVIPDQNTDCIIAPSSMYQPIIDQAGAVCRSITINPGAILTVNTGYNLNIFGNYNNQGSFNANTGSQIIFNGSSAQTMNGIMVFPSEFAKLTINKTGSNITTNQNIEIYENFNVLSSGFGFIGNNNTVSVAGNIDLASNSYSPGVSGIFKIIGNTNPQTISCNGNSFTNFVMNKTGALNLNNTITITGVLTLTKGIIKTMLYEVHVSNTAQGAINGHNLNSYVNGNLRRNITSIYKYAFPVGSPTKYALAEIKINSALSGTTSLRARFFYIFSNNGSMDPAKAKDGLVVYDHICSEGIWEIDPNASPSSGNYNIMLYFNSGISGSFFSGLMDNAFAPLKRPTNSTSAFDWTANPSTSTIPASGTPGRTVASGFAQRNGLTSFSGFSIGYTSTFLPVELLNFNAVCKNSNNVLITWSTATETNNDYFYIQKSDDGINFTDTYRIEGAGNSNVITDYLFYDNDLSEDKTTYYRLKQVDFDGSAEYSNIQAVQCGSDINPDIMLIPNPSIEGSEILIVGNYSTFTITNILGQPVQYYSNKQTISGLKSGVYIISFDGTTKLKFVVTKP